LRLEIVELLKTGEHRFKYWTSWILGSLINLIVHCFNCRLIHLYDVSQFDRVSREGRRGCRAYTIIYQTAKHRPGLYQSVGFRADPPLKTKNLAKFMDIEAKNKDQLVKPYNILLESKDKYGEKYYFNISTGLAYYYPKRPYEIITSYSDLITYDKIESYLRAEEPLDIDILDDLYEKSVVNKLTNQRVVSIKNFANELSEMGVNFRPDTIYKYFGKKVFDQFYNDFGLCPVCGSIIDQTKPIDFLYEENISKFGIALVDDPDYYSINGLIVKVIRKEFDEYYRVKMIEAVTSSTRPNQTIARNKLKNDICPKCLEHSKKLRREGLLSNYDLLTYSEIQVYIYRLMLDWPCSFYYARHKDIIKAKIKETFKELESFLNYGYEYKDGDTTNILFSYKMFSNWNFGIFGKQLENERYIFNNEVWDSISSNGIELIRSNWLRHIPLFGNAEIESLRGLYNGSCACDRCPYLKLSKIEKTLEDLINDKDLAHYLSENLEYIKDSVITMLQEDPEYKKEWESYSCNGF